MTAAQDSVVGSFPDGWERATVGSAYEIHNQNRLPLSRERRREMAGPYPYYGPTGVLDYINEYRFDGKFALIGEDGDNFLKFATHPMTLLARGRFNVNNHAHVVGSDGVNLVEWFKTYFENRDITAHLTRQGASRYKLTKAALTELPIPVPSKQEQQAIVNAVSDISDLLRLLDSLVTKKQEIRRGLMQQLLTGRTRLPGFTETWRRCSISELLRPRSERNASAENLTVLTCTKSMGFVRSMDYFKNQVFSRDLRGYRVIHRGDIGYPANHVEEGSIGVQELEDRALVSPIYVVMEPRPGVDSYFLQRMLKLETYRQKFSQATNASVDRRGSLRWSEFSQIEVSVPDVEEQRRISCVLRDSELEIEKLEQRLRVARDIKRGVMQELLSGRTRLPVHGEASQHE
ncbi:restriction endonuclease subunit S [Streptomyces sp. NPDC048606]|uniref:restriction endonuclease subunit S n=1 Tax=Streptomyces sp. NPDC048606 TaxID=3154726 RepID=UPI0034262467